MIQLLLSFFAAEPVSEVIRPRREPQARLLVAGASLRPAAVRIGRVLRCAGGIAAEAAGFVVLVLGCWLALAAMNLFVF